MFAVARNQSNADKHVDTRATVIICDLTDVTPLQPLLSSVDTVFHLGAFFKEYTGDKTTSDEPILQSVNVDAVINLLNLCHESNNVKTFIHTSTMGVLSPTVNNESAPHNTSTPNRYFQSKIRAEEAITKWRATHDTPSVRLVLPAAVCGPGDIGPTPLGKTVLEVLRGTLPVSPPGALNLVDVRDVAKVMIAAASERGQDGERYIACAGYRTMNETLREIASVANVRAPSIKMPYSVAMLYAGASELGAKIRGVPPLATRVMINTLVDNTELDGSKAVRELGIRYRDIESSWRDEVKWYRDNNYV